MPLSIQQRPVQLAADDCTIALHPGGRRGGFGQWCAEHERHPKLCGNGDSARRPYPLRRNDGQRAVWILDQRRCWPDYTVQVSTNLTSGTSVQQQFTSLP